ncbi:4Fe-4S dicluster domain-containing protein [Nitratireductor sp. CAU 1489]|uniref:4Fe-4S dicluster domain-containing protein n=1 Tax=Nitratireductor arenosus TaxID=2682096 RepID=A0A844QJG4_9HYPH|nr:4Fe-4S dicluster domain-containing protein [Nitratireductor arenosus]
MAPAYLSRRAFLTATGSRDTAARLTIGPDCLTLAGIACMSCRDACDDDVIRFTPQHGGPFRPTIDQDACTRCGACVALCPVGAIGIAEAGHG